MVALGGWTSRRHIPIIDNEGCNFFCTDRIKPVSSDSFFFSKDRPWYCRRYTLRLHGSDTKSMISLPSMTADYAER